MAERIGKLERWILVHALLKERGELPEGWERPRYHPKARRMQRLAELDQEETAFDNTHLLQDEVLLNYFSLERSMKQPRARAGFGRPGKTAETPAARGTLICGYLRRELVQTGCVVIPG